MNNINKTIKGVSLLTDINLALESGHIYGFVGDNGSGKTVLFKVLLGLMHKTSGTILVDGREQKDLMQDVGFIIERPEYIPYYSAKKNLEIIAAYRKVADDQRIRTVLEMFGLDPSDKKAVGKYSLGMKQKLALSMAFLEDPKVLILDEPLSGTGTLKPANTYSVKSLVPGKVLTGGFEEGDIVEEGTVLYTVDSSDATTKVEQAAITLQQAQRSYDKTADHQYVRAEVAGVVSSLKVNKGDEVKSGQEVAVVRDSSKMNLVLEFPAADAANFSAGQTAQVTLDGTFEVLPGTITAVTGDRKSTV